MGAFLKHEYKRGFVLTEEALVKIEDIIRKRIPDLPSDAVVFRIFRGNGLTVDYNKPSEFIKENSLRYSDISEIHVAINVDDFKFLLIFSREKDASVRLETVDRDVAFLLSSDLKEYMSSEVLIHRSWRIGKFLPNTMIFPLGIALGMIATLVLANRPGQITLDQALSTSSVETKLDFLLQKNAAFTSGYFSLIFLLPILLIICSIASTAAVNFFYPKNVFYFGKEAETFEKIKVFREKLLWGVLIALVVSLGAAYIGSRSGLS